MSNGLDVLFGDAGEGSFPAFGAVVGVLGGLGPELHPSQLRLADIEIDRCRCENVTKIRGSFRVERGTYLV